MPITEIVRVLAGGTTAEGTAVQLVYDVDGRMGPDEEATSRPWFWLRLQASVPQVLGPFADEPEALEAAEDLGVTWG
jgi:hypothetical protein